VTGSLATILWLTALRREGLGVSGWTFLKLGILVMPPASALAIGGVFLSPLPSRMKDISMQGISAYWLYPLIAIAGALQAWGPPMNGALRNSLSNPWLSSLVSFLPIVALLFCIWLCFPRPMPTLEGVQNMPWWAPLGGVIGAFAVVAGLVFVNQVGAGPFAAWLITANILMSLVIDKFGMFGMDQHPLSLWRMLGGAFMVVGVILITKF
jgi:transporter family-2 protein